MRYIIVLYFLSLSFQSQSQELFTWSEPASNMAAKSFGFRANNLLMNNKSTDKYEYRLLPEIMWGASARIMIHLEVFFGKRYNTGFEALGASLYFKYRFFSRDEVHSHFRMAAFARAGFSNNYIHQQAIYLNGDNSGYEAGLVATKLDNKIAVSAGVSLLHAIDNAAGNKYPFENKTKTALSYNLSFGKLMLPKEYKSYRQVNMNCMLEALGQLNTGNGNSYLDVAPTVQFIVESRMRIDAGYRFAVIKDLPRHSNNVFLLRLEYNIFNAY